MKKVFLKAGDLFYSDHEMVIKTILGSCISVCVYDKKKQCGGMNHYLLPFKDECSKNQSLNHYAEFAIPNLLKVMKNNFKSKKEDLEITILGGSSKITFKDHKMEVGNLNIDVAHKIIKEFGLEITAQHVGGKSGREVNFNVVTGEINYKII